MDIALAKDACFVVLVGIVVPVFLPGFLFSLGRRVHTAVNAKGERQPARGLFLNAVSTPSCRVCVQRRPSWQMLPSYTSRERSQWTAPANILNRIFGFNRDSGFSIICKTW